MRSAWAFTLALVLTACGSAKAPEGQRLRLATTTSVVDSGLLEELLPAFEKKSGQRVEVIAVGSGRAIELLLAGKADVAITHSPADERRATGKVRRTPVMKNEFVLVGPPDAAATVAGVTDAAGAMKAIQASGRPFVSRADGSGTNARETELWRAAGVTPGRLVEAKAGMGKTLARAAEERAFTLSDRATYLAKHKGLDLVVVFQGDAALDNVYSVLEPNGRAVGLADFLRSETGRHLIGGYGIETAGEPLFTPVL